MIESRLEAKKATVDDLLARIYPWRTGIDEKGVESLASLRQKARDAYRRHMRNFFRSVT